MKKIVAVAILFCTTILSVFAQQYISNHYDEKKMNCHRLMWDTHTDQFGRLWFANNQGVVKFDGNNWTLYPTPNPVRNIMVNAKGQIFVTCINDFGVLDNQVGENYQYTSFRKQAEMDNNQVSGEEKVLMVGDQIFYVFKNKLVKISEQSGTLTATIIPTEISLGALSLNQSLYLNITKMGLCMVSGSAYKLVENGNLLIGKRIISTTTIDDKVIIATAFDGIFLLHQNKLISIQGNIQSFASKGLVDIAYLDNNVLAIGSLHDGVQLYRVDGLSMNMIKTLPIPSGEIYHLHTDAEKNLWIAHAKGLSHFLVNLPLRIYDNILMKGNISRIYESGSQVYIATTDGLYQLNSATPNQFSKLIEGECWDVLSNQQSIWVASTNGLYQIENGTVKLVVSNEIFVKLQLGNLSKSLYAFSVNGCFRVSNAPQKIAGMDELANSVFEAKDGSLWFGTDFNGVKQIQPGKVGVELKDDLKLGKVIIRMVRDKPVFQTKENVYILDEKSFIPDQQLASILLGTLTNNFNCGDEYIVFTDKDLRLIKGDSLMVGSILYSISGRPTAVCKIGNSTWAAFEDKLYVAENEFLFTSIPRTFISSVNNSHLGEIYFINHVKEKSGMIETQSVIPEIDFTSNNLRIYLGINSLVNPEQHAYRFQINGSDWSEWKKDAFIDLNALASGKYTITIQGKNAFNQIAEPATFSCYIKSPWYLSSYAFLVYICLSIVLIYLIIYLNNKRLTSLNNELEVKVKERTTELIEEKKKSDDLLHNILPEEVALELKRKGHAEAKLYNHVSVLFTDFVGFTTISEQLSPTELVREIHENFTAFDSIIERNGLEKIKTIGDAYLAVCGLPHLTHEHAQKVVKAALEIRDYMANSDGKFQVRIGIHSGPVVAGIVGVKKYAYDIWGDTVNTAARMEQNSEAGKINISGVTYELIKQDFNCEYRGKIKAKNKGEVDMYFVGS